MPRWGWHWGYELITSQYSKVRISELNSHNKNLIVLYWASWCSACAKSIINYKKQVQLTDTNTIYINVALDRDVASWEKAKIKKGLTMNAYLDSNFSNSFANYFSINSVPGFFLIDSNNKFKSLGDEIMANR